MCSKRGAVRRIANGSTQEELPDAPFGDRARHAMFYHNAVWSCWVGRWFPSSEILPTWMCRRAATLENAGRPRECAMASKRWKCVCPPLRPASEMSGPPGRHCTQLSASVSGGPKRFEVRRLPRETVAFCSFRLASHHTLSAEMSLPPTTVATGLS